MSEKTSIIICHSDESEYLNIYLQSIILCSKNNDYEIIIVDNNSEKEKNINFINNLKKYQQVKIIELKEKKSYIECLIEGYNKSDDQAEYIIFSHSDNVILTNKWLDFLISQDLENNKNGCLCVGPKMSFSGPQGQDLQAPNYNFIFLNKKIFNAIGKFNKYQECKNVGAFVGLQVLLNKINKESIMINPLGFMHHYAINKTTKEEKIKDLELFNKINLIK